ncbi:MAG: sterol desaturase family protein [Muriicola sp.]|nr:sterol desaturase family protein [Muriicola sp.]NNK10970.1 sterol desaturase family protein [Flavobacteriaceae bacterium]
MEVIKPTIEMWILVSLLFVLRYLIMAGIPFLVFYVIPGKKLQQAKIQENTPEAKKIGKEIFYSLITLFIYGSGIWFFTAWVQHGMTMHYNEISDYGAPYAILSFIMMVFLHDTYFYWTHRLIHHKSLFRYIHKVHHQFTNPTPWAAFSFHPFEAILSMGVIPIIIFCLPWHQYTLIAFISFMTLYDVYIHLGYDPRGLRIGSWQITPTDHNHHHQDARVNYGLYFSFWDQLMGTYKKYQKKRISKEIPVS